MTIYLYVKTHNKTGLKYLGKTTQTDPHKYTGSGTRWLRHLKKHGYDYSTEILLECSTEFELKYWGIYYSNLWNVVENNNWANLKTEEGHGGNHSIETRIKISKSHKGKTQSEEHIRKRSLAKLGHTTSDETKEKISLAKKGKLNSKESNIKRSNSLKGRSLSEETKQKLSTVNKGKKRGPYKKKFQLPGYLPI